MVAHQAKIEPAGLVDTVLQGSERVLSFPGRSQYAPDGGGASACGLAAMNFARVILSKSKSTTECDRHFLEDLCKQETSEEILSICTQWSGPAHLDVEDIFQAPVFQKTLSLLWQEYERPGLAQFQQLLRRLRATSHQCAVAIITRPPEIVAVLRLNCEDTDVFVLFDSHPRPRHPDGAGLIFNTSIDAAARCLADLLQYDPRLLEDRSLQWQAQLLANYSAHVFLPNPRTPEISDWTETAIDSSLALLAIRAEVARLEERNRYLQSENQRLNDDVERLEGEVEDLREAQRRASREKSAASRLSALVPNAFASTSKGKQPAKQDSPTRDRDAPRAPSGTKSRKRNGQRSARSNKGPSNHPDHDYDDGWRIPESEWVMSPETSDATTLDSPQDRISRSNGADVWDGWREPDVHNVGWAAGGDDDDDPGWTLGPASSDVTYALEAQREYDREDRLLRDQHAKLKAAVPATFNCGICLDEEPVYLIARPEPCGHSFCRDCIRDYLRSKIGEHRYPIICPTCAADRDMAQPSTLNSLFVEQIGISEKEANDFMELELSSLSILLHCRGCGGQAFVDKGEYQEARIVSCPLPRCSHAWCKSCSQAVQVGGVEHSCDGTTELAHLMNAQGWKHCPGCRTPTEKTSGCNHMTCASPGCNMHFCYVCGEAIVQSALRSDIQREVSAHYRRCRIH